MRNRTLFLLWAIVLFAVAAHAAEPKNFAGTWAMKLGARNVIVLHLTVDGDKISGVWDRPAHYSASNGVYANISNDAQHLPLGKPTIANGVLSFTLPDPKAATESDPFTMSVEGDHASVAYADLPPGLVLPPLRFERVAPDAVVATDWQPNRLYTANDSDEPSDRMKAIYDADQQARSGGIKDANALSQSDAERREQTRNLLAAGALHTGKDFEEASFLFQHGTTPDDFLMAHTLAMIAVAKGDSTAIWIAAATLDRYLQSNSQRQIYGTQFLRDNKGMMTQEPYNRDLISDALREQLAVPTQPQQTEQLKAIQAQQKAIQK